MAKTTLHRETEQEKAERKTRVEDAACSLRTNAVDTAKEIHRNWREMSFNEWLNAVDEQKLAQLSMFADQYGIDPDELRVELGML